MRNAWACPDESRSDRLLIRADETDIGCGGASIRYGIARRDALPGGCGHQSFTKNSLGTQAHPAPVLPSCAFRFVRARTATEPVVKQFSGSAAIQLPAHVPRSQIPVTVHGIGMSIGDGRQLDACRDLVLAAQA